MRNDCMKITSARYVFKEKNNKKQNKTAVEAVRYMHGERDGGKCLRRDLTLQILSITVKVKVEVEVEVKVKVKQAN